VAATEFRRRRLRIGTRGSPLALVQSEEVRARLVLTHPALGEPGAVEIVVIKTTGDRIVDRPLADVGGKGLFTKEIDEALLDGRINLAVHSVKDLPTWLPARIVLAATLTREDPRDALVATGARAIADLLEGCVVGTSSLRRQAQLLHHRPDLRVVPLRGNVATRLRKVKERVIGATLLAVAGINRLTRLGKLAVGGGPTDFPVVPIATDLMLPAVGQGAIGLTCLAGDEAIRMMLAAVDDRPTHVCIVAERAMLEALDGSCRTPIAGLATFAEDDVIDLSGLVARPDGSRLRTARSSGGAADAARLGKALGEVLRGEGDLDVLAQDR
jgi:hydroxymethylbilane synthase